MSFIIIGTFIGKVLTNPISFAHTIIYVLEKYVDTIFVSKPNSFFRPTNCLFPRIIILLRKLHN